MSKDRRVNVVLQPVLLRRTGRPVIGRSARGREEGVLAGPGRVAGGCLGLWADAKASTRWPDACRSEALTGRNVRSGKRAYQLTRWSSPAPAPVSRRARPSRPPWVRGRVSVARGVQGWGASRPPAHLSMPAPSVASWARQTGPLPGPGIRVPSGRGLRCGPARPGRRLF